jgi:hypothetical protein
MKRFMNIAMGALLLTFVLAGAAPAQDAGSQTMKKAKMHKVSAAAMSVPDRLTRMETELRESVVKGDTSFMEKYYADDYAGWSPDGKLLNKQQTIDAFKSGMVKYESIEPTELKVTQYGPNTAIMRASANVKGTMNGQPVDGTYQATRVWVKRGGRWKVVSFQTVRRQ